MYVAAAIPQGLFSKLLVFLPELVAVASPILEPALIVTGSLVLVTGAGVWIYRRSQRAREKKREASTSAPVIGARADEPSATQTQASAPNRSLRQTQLNPETLMSFVKPRHPHGQAAEVTVFAPWAAPPREEFVVQVMVHAPELQDEARSRAEKNQPNAAQLASTPLHLPLTFDDKIAIRFECPQFTVPNSVQKGVWNGRLIILFFSIFLPDLKKELKVHTRAFRICQRSRGRHNPLHYNRKAGCGRSTFGVRAARRPDLSPAVHVLCFSGSSESFAVRACI